MNSIIEKKKDGNCIILKKNEKKKVNLRKKFKEFLDLNLFFMILGNVVYRIKLIQ